LRATGCASLSFHWLSVRWPRKANLKLATCNS
jgi:hypothetical protein